MTSNQLMYYLIKAPKSNIYSYLELNKHRTLSIHWNRNNTICLALEIYTSTHPITHITHNFVIYPPTKDSGKIVALLRIKYPNFFNTYSRLKSYIKEDKSNGK